MLDMPAILPLNRSNAIDDSPISKPPNREETGVKFSMINPNIAIE
jgi:hypothetical protein